MSAPESPAVAVVQLSKRYRATIAVDGVSVQIPARVVCGLIGPNGAGKTTLLRMLLGLVRPTSGSGTVLGRSLDRPADYLVNVGALIEGPAFYPGLTGRANLELLARLGRIGPRQVEAALTRVGLAEHAEKQVRAYSFGMKQRLGVAAALLPAPALLILDEPMNGLDPAGIVEMRELLRELADQGTTVIVSSHLLGEVEQVCDHLVMLLGGRVVFSDPTDVFTRQVRSRLLLRPEHSEDLPRLIRLTQEAGYLVRLDEGAVIAEATDPDAAALNRAAHAAGIILIELSTHQPSLEQVFFQRTQLAPEGAVGGERAR